MYLYIGSMIFLLFMYATLIWGRPKLPVPIGKFRKSTKLSGLFNRKRVLCTPASPSKSATKASGTDSMDESDTDSNSVHHRLPPPIPVRRPSLLSPLGRRDAHYGSFYLRMGAVGKCPPPVLLQSFVHIILILNVVNYSLWNWQHDLFGLGIWPVL